MGNEQPAPPKKRETKSQAEEPTKIDDTPENVARSLFGKKPNPTQETPSKKQPRKNKPPLHWKIA